MSLKLEATSLESKVSLEKEIQRRESYAACTRRDAAATTYVYIGNDDAVRDRLKRRFRSSGRILNRRRRRRRRRYKIRTGGSDTLL